MSKNDGFSLADFGIHLGAQRGGPVVAQPLARMREAAGLTLDDEDRGWRTLTGQTKRDLTPLGQARMQQLAAYLWETNLLANRLIELPLAFLLAEGVRLTCQDEEHQKWLDAFWHDPITKMDLRLPTFVRELALFGEQVLPAYVNDVNGHVRLGYLDPSLIEHVVHDPGNPSQEIGVITLKDAAGQVRKFRTIVRGEDEELFAPEARTLRASFASGDAFYFAVNKFAAGKRGRSDLIAQMDWLDGYDEFLFDQMERGAELDAFIWDVKLTGAGPEEVAARAKELQKPGRGSVRVHNDMEEWKAEAPSLNAVDRAETARLLRNHALGGASVPEHFYGGGGDVNRAAAAEMGDPFYKVATMRQSHLKHMLQEIGSYVLWSRARATGQTPDWGEEAWKVAASFPELVTKDVSKLASALQATVAAVSAAIAERLITKATGLRILAIAAKRLDVEIDPEEELAAVAEEEPEDTPASMAGRAGNAAGNNPGAGTPDLEPGDDAPEPKPATPRKAGRS
jgi:hypothetical protein